jgi:hypothetical protein
VLTLPLGLVAADQRRSSPPPLDASSHADEAMHRRAPPSERLAWWGLACG